MDLSINPDRTWHWKDLADHEMAISQDLAGASTRLHPKREAELVLDELGRRDAPFTEEFTGFRRIENGPFL